MIKNHYGIVINSEEAITGVFQNNHCEWLFDAPEDEVDIHFIGHCEECQNENHDNCYHPDNAQTILQGFKSTSSQEESWYWFPNQKIGYMPHPNAEFSCISGEVYTQVVRGEWGIRCSLCSSCYPGQGDANNPGDFLAYSLPPDVIGDDEAVTKRVFRLEE